MVKGLLTSSIGVGGGGGGEWLLNGMALSCTMFSVKSFYAVTNFLTSSREGHYSVAKLILDSNAEVNVPSGSENNIPLTLACWKGVVYF